MQLTFDFSVQIVIPLYRMSWREGSILQVVEVSAHPVRLDG